MDPIKYARQIKHYRNKINSGWTPDYGDEGVRDWSNGLRTKCDMVDGTPVVVFYAEQPGGEYNGLGSYRLDS